MGKFVKTNKRTGWNKRTVGKIEPKYCLIIPILFVNFLLSLEVWSKIEIIAQINKRTGWNKSVLVGKNPQKLINVPVRLFGTLEYNGFKLKHNLAHDKVFHLTLQNLEEDQYVSMNNSVE